MDAIRDPARGPVRPDERAPAPDLARGFMLLLIALANTPWYLYAAQQAGTVAHPADGSAVDRVVQFAMLTAVDGRILPMFALLFGYGLIRLYDRQREAGTRIKAAAAVVQRRNLWLLVLGFAHAALLFTGDILAAYGLTGLVLGWLLLRRSERAMRVTAAVLVGLSLALLLILGLSAAAATLIPAGGGEQAAGSPGFFYDSFSEPGYFASIGPRILGWLFLLPLTVLMPVIPAMIALGMAIGRLRVLERTEHYRGLLAWTAAIGIGGAWLCGLPEALVHVGLVDASETVALSLGGVRQMSGVLGGPGYVALFGLVGDALARRARRGAGVVAVAAVGKRSLSCYLAQSVICAPLLAAWGLGLGAQLGSATMALFAVGVWLVTLVGAYGLERAGRRGPAEALMRRLVYRSPASTEPAAGVSTAPGADRAGRPSGPGGPPATR
ncbi:DUF418 domain-containing protein [Streptomonospora litoralis]|uniref:DUF418 domain-containing protein n=1 Tax=Streptomonospora litoralis TaxID=2498135 RepID=A0A4P6Q087_9ACTN|nr:DUF418 domain-containing protein [Streptomonospora litoralis]QBI53823.1 hypothetical protein EKD16_10185 [Streptomonospora litoralis]